MMKLQRINILALLLVWMSGFAMAFVGESSSYTIDSLHLGTTGGNWSSSSYVSRSTLTYEQGGNRNLTTEDYLANSGWFNVSFDIFPDNTPPAVNLESPSDGSVRATSNTIVFYYNVSEENTIANCTLILNHNDVNATSTTVIKDAAGQSLTTTIENGEYNWSVNCTDGTNNIGPSGVWNLRVTYSPPSPPGGGDGGSNPPPEEPEIPPVEPPITPPEPEPFPKTPSPEPPGGHPANRSEPRNNIQRCWNSTIEEKDAESLAYLYNMIPCPEEAPAEKPEIITGKAWCNGIEIDLSETGSVKVGFVDGSPRYNLDFRGEGKNQSYCPWCFDGKKDYDEEDTDCGLSCEPCLKPEQPGVLPANLRCDDRTCDEGNEYSCPEDCRKPGLTLALLAYLLAALVANAILWRLVRRRIKPGKRLGIAFGLVSVAISGVMVWVVVSHVCISPLDCEQLITILAVVGIAGIMYVLVWWGAEGVAWVKDRLIFYLEDRRSAEYYQERKEIKTMIEKGEQYLEKDSYASGAIYSAIKPLYDSLPPEHKKKVIGRIRRFYTEIINKMRGR